MPNRNWQVWRGCSSEVRGKNCGFVFRRDELGEKDNNQMRKFMEHFENQKGNRKRLRFENQHYKVK